MKLKQILSKVIYKLRYIWRRFLFGVEALNIQIEVSLKELNDDLRRWINAQD